MNLKYKDSIVVTHPKVAAQWNYTKNKKRPEEVTAGMRKKVWWKCPVADDHEWCVAVKDRIRRGCPYCSGKQVVLSNCLSTTHSKIAAEWNYNKNSITPNEVLAGSNIKVYWTCKKCEHTWISAISDRTRKHGCPNCRNKNKIGPASSRWKGYGEIGATYWSQLKRGAKNRGYEFSITIQYIWDLFLKQNRRCAFTGRTLILPTLRDSKNIGTASLDRIDSTEGYKDGNVQWVHKNIQVSKSF